ncbi:methyltransferase type 11 [Purpureocillium lavendulum]|uniref:Methyltransferase type 11 n=1 Tax=Purpureocillium lavendulum TaxID=1247861 RepID=A0AB34G5X0_9HYPO|nr:methyltransferase type 11 [Purpureocillium lavendulum]
MAQNIYDRQDFFDAYIKYIDRSSKDVDTDPAWSRLVLLLPPVAGLDVLDLGCGSGWFCRWAAANGARSVLGVDISQNMLAKARGLATSSTDEEASRIEYRCADLDELTLPESDTARYGLVFSSLVLHYLADLPRVVALAHRVLAPGGFFVVNVEHPIYTAPRNPRVVRAAEENGSTGGDNTGELCWPLSGYGDEGERVVDWLAKGLHKYHRSVTGYLDVLLAQGFLIRAFKEFFPTDEELTSGKADEMEKLRPLFLMMSLQKQN